MEQWIKFLKPYLVSAVIGLALAVVFPVTNQAEASPIKNWTSNEYVTASDLNANFNHLHANLGHGHGPIITAADISSSAGIRPEQTTFGASINRSLVHVGTYIENPDGGTAYMPINWTGTLAVTVTKIGTSGFEIDGAAAAGALSDGGVGIYTVFYRPVNFAIADSVLCSDQGAPGQTFGSPLHVAVDCYDLTDATWPMSNIDPSGVAIEIYSNKVQ